MQDRKAPITQSGKTPEEKLEMITTLSSIEGWENFIDNLFYDWLISYKSTRKERDDVLCRVITLKEFFKTLKP